MGRDKTNVDKRTARERRRRCFRRRQVRRLQRSVETLAVLSEMEQSTECNGDFDVSFSLDEMGEMSDQVFATVNASVSFDLGHLRWKGYKRCKEKSLNESFAASSTEEPPVFRQSSLNDTSTTTTTLTFNSRTCQDLSYEEQECLLPDPVINLPSAATARDVDFDVEEQLIPQPAAPVAPVPVYRRVCKSSFSRLPVQPMKAVTSDYEGLRLRSGKMYKHQAREQHHYQPYLTAQTQINTRIKPDLKRLKPGMTGQIYQKSSFTMLKANVFN